MNRMHQVLVGIISSILLAVSSATEKKPFYEVLHNSEFIFQIEDYHADMVLGMLPHIKTSIKDFRKRNFTSNDIENMYETLTIFWPVIRKYLHLKEELVDNDSSEAIGQYNHNNSISSPENYQIQTKDSAEGSNEINRMQTLQPSPITGKRVQPIYPKTEFNKTSVNETKGTIPSPKTILPTFSHNKQSTGRRKYIARFNSLRGSVPSRQMDQTGSDNPDSSTSSPTRDKQLASRSNLLKIKGIRESSSVGNQRINNESNLQSARINERPFESIRHRSFSRTTTRRPSRRPSISNTEQVPEKVTSEKPFSYTTRRPYKRMFRLISKDSIPPVLERLVKTTGSNAVYDSANVSQSKYNINYPELMRTRRPSKTNLKLINRDPKSTAEEVARSTTTTRQSPSRIPFKPLNRGSISTQEERPFTSFYHLFGNSGVNFQQTATNNPDPDNILKSARTISTLISDQTTSSTISKTTRASNRSLSTKSSTRSISTTIPTQAFDSTISHTTPKMSSSSSTQSPENINSRNFENNRNEALEIFSKQTLQQPINENMVFFTDLSSIKQALGNPIDLTKLFA